MIKLLIYSYYSMDDSVSNQDLVQEGEIVTSDVAPEPQNGEAVVLLNLESLIKGNISQIEKLGDEIKKQNEMLTNVFENDPTYVQHSEAAKEAARIKGNTKKEIMKRPDVSHLAEKVKGQKSELKELKESLSSYLQEFQRLSGLNEIEGEDGSVRQIVYSAKLIKVSRGQ